MIDYNPTDKRREEVLKNFMLEHFDFTALKRCGIYGPEIKSNNYKAQSEMLCKFFGFKTIYEYGAIKPVSAHLSYTEGHRPPTEPFIIEIIGCFFE